MRSAIYLGDAFEAIWELPAGSIHCCITSTPYYGKRLYGIEPTVIGGSLECAHDWAIECHPDGYRAGDTNPGPQQSNGTFGRNRFTSHECSKCLAWRGELGMEGSALRFVQHLRLVFSGVYRALRDDGILWLNIGDSYDMSKRLLMVPFLLASGLQNDGWLLRQIVIWNKPNPARESVKDRPTAAHEYILMLTKGPSYFYDNVASAAPSGANRLSVWTVSPDSFGGHTACFSPKLIEPAILASTSEKGCCWQCGSPLRRLTKPGTRETAAWAVDCECEWDIEPGFAPPWKPGVVLDPFSGTGTTAATAARLGRRYIGIERSPEYVELTRQRFAEAGLPEPEVIPVRT